MNKLTIHHLDGTQAQITPCKSWSPCFGEDCQHSDCIEKRRLNIDNKYKLVVWDISQEKLGKEFEEILYDNLDNFLVYA